MKEIDINIEGYNVNGICVGCLNYNRKMIYHKDVKECFINLADIDIPDGLSVQVCWECLASVKRVCQFRTKLLKSYEILINYSRQHTFLNSPSDFTKYSTTRLGVSSTANTSIVPPSILSKENDENKVKSQIKCETEDTQYDCELEPLKEEDESFNECDDIQIEDYEHKNLQLQIEVVKDELSSEDDMQLSELKQKKDRREKTRKIKKHRKSSSDKMASSSDSEGSLTPPELKETAQTAIETLLPEKSRNKYNKAYEDFIQWKRKKNAPRFSENVLLAYFSEKAQKYKPSTLWTFYSMLKMTLMARNDINIVEYRKLAAFLKRNSKGFYCKKSRIFTTKDVYSFLKNAPDDKYLLMKVILILGVNGACRSHELVNLTTDDINFLENVMVVKIPNIISKIHRSFVLSDLFYEIVKKYLTLRPKDMKTNRFLLQYKDSKCVKQVIGKNKISTVPKEIASYLNLPDPQEYTGHCFRKSSASFLADSGPDLPTMKRHGDWTSSGVAEDDTENSVENETRVNDQIAESINLHQDFSQTSKSVASPMAAQPSSSTVPIELPVISSTLPQTSQTVIKIEF